MGEDKEDKQAEEQPRKLKGRHSMSKAIRLRKSLDEKTSDKPVLQIKINSENLLFKQVVSEHDLLKQEQSKHYAYLYDLPYVMTERDGKELVEYLQ